MDERVVDYINLLIVNYYNNVAILDNDKYYRELINYVAQHFEQYDNNKILNGLMDDEIISFVHDIFVEDGYLKDDNLDDLDRQISVFENPQKISRENKEKSNDEVIEELIRVRDNFFSQTSLDNKKKCVYQYLHEIVNKYNLSFKKLGTVDHALEIIMKLYIQDNMYDDILYGNLDKYVEYYVICFSDQYEKIRSEVFNIIKQRIEGNFDFALIQDEILNDICYMLIKKGHDKIAPDDIGEIDNIFCFYAKKISNEKRAIKNFSRYNKEELIKKIKQIRLGTIAKTLGISALLVVGVITLPYTIIPGSFYLLDEAYKHKNKMR